jgi:hypothetical protein
MRSLFIIFALAACGDGSSSHSSDVSRFVGIWQVSGGGGEWHCNDGTSGTKSVGVGQQYTIGADTGHDLLATTPSGCTEALDVSGEHASGGGLVCQGQPLAGTSTLTLTNGVLTWIDSIPFTQNGATCTETDTALFSRAS